MVRSSGHTAVLLSHNFRSSASNSICPAWHRLATQGTYLSKVSLSRLQSPYHSARLGLPDYKVAKARLLRAPKIDANPERAREGEGGLQK